MAFSASPVKEAVVEILRDAPGLEGVHVRRGLPTKAVPEDEPDRVFVTGSRGIDREKTGGTMREDFRIYLVLEVLGVPGDDAEVTEARMWEIADAIDAQATRDPEWGVAAWGSTLHLLDEHTAPYPGNERHVARGHFALQCHARQ